MKSRTSLSMRVLAILALLAVALAPWTGTPVVAQTNQAPIFEQCGDVIYPGPFTTSYVVQIGSPLSFVVEAVDRDSASVSLSWTGLPAGATATQQFPGGTVAVVNYQFDWTPTAADAGNYTVTFTATDTEGLTAGVNCVISIEVPPPPPPPTCPLTQGYWKTHAEAWPVNSLTLGSQSYTQAELLTIFNTPVRGDASLNLAHQLIAAKLNAANGANTASISGAISAADGLLSGYSGKLPYDVRSSSSAGQQMTNYAGMLDNFNNGNTIDGCAH